MSNRSSAILLTLLLVSAFITSLLLKPLESRANSRSGWRAEYFDNAQLAGEPVITTIDEVIEMNWYTEAPYAELPDDYFSVRWTRLLTVEEGVYRFRVGADDGFRLWIDDILILEAFSEGSFRDLTRDVRLTKGEHEAVVEYFEAQHVAGVLVEWGLSPAPSDVLDLETQTIETPQPVATASPQYAYIAGTNAPLYARPAITAPRLTQLGFSHAYPIMAVSGDGAWYEVKVSEDLRGWIPVHTSYAPTLENINQVELGKNDRYTEVEGVALTDLVLWREPAQTALATTLRKDTPVRVLGRNAEGTWYYVAWTPAPEADSQAAWVFAPYVRLTIGTWSDLELR